MERTRYGRRLPLDPTAVASNNGSYYESWEEKAFAQDSAGLLGGCIWPPRSYSCSFCQREFRSAQALGGHMNVHRRDRARLKHPPSPTSESTDDHQHHHSLNSHNPNPNSAPLSFSSVSAASTDESSKRNTLLSTSYSSSIYRESWKEETSPFSSPRYHKNSTNVRLVTIPTLKLARDDLNRGGEEEDVLDTKRRRIDPPLPFSLSTALDEEQIFESKVLELHPNNVEELDLELRLGDRPKVNEIAAPLGLD